MANPTISNFTQSAASIARTSSYDFRLVQGVPTDSEPVSVVPSTQASVSGDVNVRCPIPVGLYSDDRADVDYVIQVRPTGCPTWFGSDPVSLVLLPTPVSAVVVS